MSAERMMLIDDQGTYHPVNGGRCWTLPTQIWAPSNGRALDVDMLVQHHGYASVRWSAKTKMVVAFSAPKISQACTAGLLLLLADQAADRVVLSVWRTGWDHRLVRSNRHAMSMIVQILEEERFGVGPALRCRELALSDTTRWPMLDNLLDAARSVGFNWRDFQSPAKMIAGSRYMLVGPRGSGTTLFIRDLGTGYSVFDPAWRSSARNRPVHEQPDYDYGRWLNTGYLAVLKSGQPRLDAVDAVVYRPDRGRQRHTYARLTIPLRDREDRPILLSSSVTDAAIDLGGLSKAS